MDFDEWAKNYKPKPPEYVAVFDPDTGFVSAVGPSYAFENENYKTSIDQETAELIIEGKIKISSCIVDPRSAEFEIVEMKNIFKIDDVLHRIISTEWSDIEKFDLYLTHNSSNKTLTIELSEEFGGSKKLPAEYQPVKVRKTVWAGDTEMNFLITEYNDPNLLYEMISVKINELLGNAKIIENIDYENFSVYTRRLFKHCVIEYK